MHTLPSQEALKLSRGNRRATVRYRCPPATSGKLFVGDDQESQRAWVINISRQGIGLVLPRAVARGIYVVIQLRSLDRQRLFELPAHVAHSTLINQTDWLLGCDLLEPLSDEDLDQLL